MELRGAHEAGARPRGGEPPTLVTASFVPWTLLQEVPEAVTWVEGTPLGTPPCLMGPLLLHQHTPSSYIYLCTPVRSEGEPKT